MFAGLFYKLLNRITMKRHVFMIASGITTTLYGLLVIKEGQIYSSFYKMNISFPYPHAVGSLFVVFGVMLIFVGSKRKY